MRWCDLKRGDVLVEIKNDFTYDGSVILVLSDARSDKGASIAYLSHISATGMPKITKEIRHDSAEIREERWQVLRTT